MNDTVVASNELWIGIFFIVALIVAYQRRQVPRFVFVIPEAVDEAQELKMKVATATDEVQSLLYEIRSVVDRAENFSVQRQELLDMAYRAQLRSSFLLWDARDALADNRLEEARQRAMSAEALIETAWQQLFDCKYPQ